MHTKGVASVRSPVHNLQQFNPSVSHERFIESAVLAFREEYRLNDDVSFLKYIGMRRGNLLTRCHIRYTM